MCRWIDVVKGDDMKLSKMFITSVSVIVAVAGLIVFAHSQNLFSTATPTTHTGLLVGFTVISDTGLNTNPRTVVLESKPICFSRRQESDVMNDPDYPGQRGETPNQVWMYLPPGCSPSINPLHSTDPILPPWWEAMQDYIADHPEVTMDQPINCQWGKIINEQWVPASAVTVFPAESLCDYNSQQDEATVIRMNLVIHGDTSDLSIPTYGFHYIYFAQ